MTSAPLMKEKHFLRHLVHSFTIIDNCHECLLSTVAVVTHAGLLVSAGRAASSLWYLSQAKWPQMLVSLKTHQLANRKLVMLQHHNMKFLKLCPVTFHSSIFFWLHLDVVSHLQVFGVSINQLLNV